jgi:aryl-alcohol dehydrogenase-like predicted oxidoreductase
MNNLQYFTLGRTGLRVSRLCLGVMSFGTGWGWGTNEGDSAAILDRYLESGGNFVDTADMYTNGQSEEILGKLVADRKIRDQVVLATKFTFSPNPANPNAGGNGRKNIYRALEASLRRLQTDYIDLYWLHAWDTVTPVEEVMLTLNDLVRSGKVRYIGLSDVPAWYLTRFQTLAEKEGKEPIAALQLEYSLVERGIEREHIPAAQELGIAICPWSPLAGGFLAGRYRRSEHGFEGEGRYQTVKDSGNPVFEKFTDRNWRILETLQEVAKAVGRPPAQVALNWVVAQPGVTSTLIGATKLEQLEQNLASLDFALSQDLRSRLDEASRLPHAHPYMFFEPPMVSMNFGRSPVVAWEPWRRHRPGVDAEG